mmetsp:Transcript_9814/g.29530  ORF Transcript_9814/g.29530 Transcript_9814/m.29530 type:complete len:442 (-) Transcript_9814:546-1871(-)
MRSSPWRVTRRVLSWLWWLWSCWGPTCRQAGAAATGPAAAAAAGWKLCTAWRQLSWGRRRRWWRHPGAPPWATLCCGTSQSRGRWGTSCGGCCRGPGRGRGGASPRLGGTSWPSCCAACWPKGPLCRVTGERAWLCWVQRQLLRPPLPFQTQATTTKPRQWCYSQQPIRLMLRRKTLTRLMGVWAGTTARGGTGIVRGKLPGSCYRSIEGTRCCSAHTLSWRRPQGVTRLPAAPLMPPLPPPLRPSPCLRLAWEVAPKRQWQLQQRWPWSVQRSSFGVAVARRRRGRCTCWSGLGATRQCSSPSRLPVANQSQGAQVTLGSPSCWQHAAGCKTGSPTASQPPLLPPPPPLRPARTAPHVTIQRMTVANAAGAARRRQRWMRRWVPWGWVPCWRPRLFWRSCCQLLLQGWSPGALRLVCATRLACTCRCQRRSRRRAGVAVR